MSAPVCSACDAPSPGVIAEAEGRGAVEDADADFARALELSDREAAAGAGAEAGFPDSEYSAKGVRIASREEIFSTADVILQVRSPGANPETGAADLALMRPGQTVIGFGEPLTAPDAARALAAQGVTFLSMELMPRITRAQ